MKKAFLYKREGKIYFLSSSRTTSGVWIDSAPFLSLEEDAESSLKREYVKMVMESSKYEIPHPTTWSNVPSPLLQISGVKSWIIFMKLAKCCSLEQKENDLKFIPYRNLGKKYGYKSMREKMLVLNDPFNISNIEKLKDTINNAFELCE